MVLGPFGALLDDGSSGKSVWFDPVHFCSVKLNRFEGTVEANNCLAVTSNANVATKLNVHQKKHRKRSTGRCFDSGIFRGKEKGLLESMKLPPFTYGTGF